MDLEKLFAKQEDDASEKQCRACLVLHFKNQVYSIDSKNLTVMDDGSEQTIADLYQQCTQLLYETADEHPKWICQCCTEKMIDFFQFRKMCIDSYNTFTLSKVSKIDEHVKVEMINVFENAASSSIELDDSIVIKVENEFECDVIQSTKNDNECSSRNSKIICETNDAKQNMTLRKRTNTGGEPSLSETNTKENEEDTHGNDEIHSDFDGFDDYGDDSSDESSVSDEKVMIFFTIKNLILNQIDKLQSFFFSH